MLSRMRASNSGRTGNFLNSMECFHDTPHLNSTGIVNFVPQYVRGRSSVALRNSATSYASSITVEPLVSKVPHAAPGVRHRSVAQNERAHALLPVAHLRRVLVDDPRDHQ